MLKVRERFVVRASGLLLVLGSVTVPAGAAELASEMIAASVENGTFNKVSQDLLMDVYQGQRYEFDEAGVEAVGRKLLAEGRYEVAIEVLRLNQMINNGSAAAANALGDAYRDAGNTAGARAMYRHAADLDSSNAHADQALNELDAAAPTAPASQSGTAGIDPEALAAVGMTPEQIGQMEQAVAQAQQMASGRTPGTPPRPATQSPSSRPVSQPAPEAAYESEYCEVLHRFNAEKKIADSDIRNRVAGEYARTDDADRLKTWNIETTCGEFLVAVPLWADVSPPVLSRIGENLFEDSQGATWDFQTGEDGAVTHVVRMASDGSVASMNRVGTPRTWGDPHEKLNGKHTKDWGGGKK